MVMSRRALPCFAIIAAVIFAPAGAGAADASAWNGDAHAGVRLIAGDAITEASGARVLRAGVEIRLAPGWKTYWRYPGDSGVPPRFDFVKSENVKNVALAWPAPLRLGDTGTVTIGYKDGVVFPLRVEPEDASKPVVLRLNLDYAICEKICIPVEGRAELRIAGAGGPGPARVARPAGPPARRGATRRSRPV